MDERRTLYIDLDGVMASRQIVRPIIAPALVQQAAMFASLLLALQVTRMANSNEFAVAPYMRRACEVMSAVLPDEPVVVHAPLFTETPRVLLACRHATTNGTPSGTVAVRIISPAA